MTINEVIELVFWLHCQEPNRNRDTHQPIQYLIEKKEITWPGGSMNLGPQDEFQQVFSLDYRTTIFYSIMVLLHQWRAWEESEQTGNDDTDDSTLASRAARIVTQNAVSLDIGKVRAIWRVLSSGRDLVIDE
jgi:hypothetical protein